jgi:hypothetical protein
VFLWGIGVQLKDPKLLNETAYGFNGPYLEETYMAEPPSHDPERTAMVRFLINI